ncbi:hypothetical protein LOTGIDRAFT_162975 [Lottia gigantea]|uniref:Uncharacterized protein n=1 Tax=Lottia gigantea TaxID=225164 RepID=V4A5K4_LOTGI|nr:hypothetical protein LOTGIDRAFT_162975 [Lottia gigantea]ESO91972.1 hypothetical protein LOTGIDRAFT_162975 [Lottia gigantea]
MSELKNILMEGIINNIPEIMSEDEEDTELVLRRQPAVRRKGYIWSSKRVSIRLLSYGIQVEKSLFVPVFCGDFLCWALFRQYIAGFKMLCGLRFCGIGRVTVADRYTVDTCCPVQISFFVYGVQLIFCCSGQKCGWGMDYFCIQKTVKRSCSEDRDSNLREYIDSPIPPPRRRGTRRNVSKLQIPGDNVSKLQVPGDNISKLQVPGDNVSKLQVPGDNVSKLQVSGVNELNLQAPGI